LTFACTTSVRSRLVMVEHHNVVPGGLQSFCVKAEAYGSYVIKNRAEYYIDFTLDLFVSVDSKASR